MSKAALLMFGPPGSGKGTISKTLMTRLGVPHISTGDILRENVQAGTELGKQAKALMGSGKLVPDEMVNQLIEQRIRRDDCANGMILDGYPRTIEQGKVLSGLLAELGLEPAVVYLDVDYNVIVGRLTARRSCPKCGAVYNLVSKPPKREGVCDADSEPLVLRDDDREDVIRRRFADYESQTQPLVEFFRGRVKQFHKVTLGDGSVDENTDRVTKLVLNG